MRNISYIFNFLFTQKIGTESLEVFHILLIANLIVVPSILIGYPFLGALGYSKYANMSVMYGSLFHLLGLFILSIGNYITIYNVAIMIIATETVVFITRIYLIRREKLWEK